MSVKVERQIPFFNYPALFASQREEFVHAFESVCSRGAYILQSDLEQFESSMRDFLGARYCWGVADGTNALLLGLHAMGIGPGDEVIVPSHTYVASVAAIHFVGATPILADCLSDHLIDPESVKTRLSSKTKAIMPVHLNGRTCAMSPLLEIAKTNDLMIIEDAAQALGSRYNGKAAGTFGAVGTISFYPAKLLGCFGDGGLVISNDPAIGEALARLRDHGRDSSGAVRSWGTNSRLDNLQAAFLNVAFKNFKKNISRRRSIALQYHEALNDIDDLLLPPPPVEAPHFDVYQNYEVESGQRDALRAYLDKYGVKTIIQWGGKAVHQMSELGLKFTGDDLPATDALFRRCFLLPMNTSLVDEDVQYIITLIRNFYNECP